MSRLLLTLACAGMLAACSEVDQSKTADNTNRGDEPAYKGAKDAFVVKNWTPGDKTSWETQLRTRGQNQNEYVKTN